MTKEEAIEILKAIYFLDEEKQKALHMAIEALEHLDNIESYMHDFDVTEEEAIKALERKRGEWLESDFGWRCSICGNTSVTWQRTYNYCPNCGADMRKEEPNDGR